MPMRWAKRVEAGDQAEEGLGCGDWAAEGQVSTGPLSVFPPEDREALHDPGRRPDLEVLTIHESRAGQQFVAVIVRVLREPTLGYRDDDINPPVLPGSDITDHDPTDLQISPCRGRVIILGPPARLAVTEGDIATIWAEGRACDQGGPPVI